MKPIYGIAAIHTPSLMLGSTIFLLARHRVALWRGIRHHTSDRSARVTDKFKKISQLNIGSVDAINYSGRQEKDFLSRVFLRDSVLDRVLESKRYFLIGEKGTGKTAYATLLSNTEHKNTASTIRSITGTDYQRFIKQKSLGHLQVSSFTDIWRVILLLLMADNVLSSEGGAILQSAKFLALKAAAKTYRNSAFAPEIINAIEFVENAEINAEFTVSNVSKIGAKEGVSLKIAGSGFQTSLIHIEQQFRDAIGSLKLSKDHILFIDGVDVRPSDIDFPLYIECIKGLANAAWSLNLDYFSNVRDSKGRMKVVVLLRPDIFDAIGFHNSNAKIRDNSVQLDWKTTYSDYRTSRLFRLIDGILAKQQENGEALTLGSAWNHYFNYFIVNKRIAERLDDPFVSFLRYSFYRPRDIISYILILQEYVGQHHPNAESFTDNDFKSCQQSYSEYLLGEVKDHLSFYHSEADFDELTGFFRFLNGKSRFSWRDFQHAFSEYNLSIKHRVLTIKQLTESPESFLQFLYSMNVIGYDETSDDELANFSHWCFRDRSSVTLNPKIPPNLGAVTERPYSVHPGLARALKVGGV